MPGGAVWFAQACCSAGADCCYPGSPCCGDGAAKASLAACCKPGAECCDAGTKVLVVGHSNDVVLYRELLKRGVSEYIVPPMQALDLILAAWDEGADTGISSQHMAYAVNAFAHGGEPGFWRARPGCGSTAEPACRPHTKRMKC